ncbi:MAG: IS200/IS605 family transposase [Bacteroidales bacterium]
MTAYRQILYHLTFHTKNSEKVLHNSGNDELFRFIWGILKNNHCKLYRINGIEDHIHIVCDLHPSAALADLVKDIKVASSKFIKEKHLYPLFSHWAEGYGAFTLSIKEKDRIVKYVMNQQQHHKKESSREEFIRLLKENGIEFDEKYLL